MKRTTREALAGLVTIKGSQARASAACGVDLSTFNRWITGKVWPPKGRLVRERLAKLGVPL